MARKRPVYPHLELCLCSSCASHYFDSPHRRIRPLDPLLPVFKPCDLCRMRCGKPFHISLPS